MPKPHLMGELKTRILPLFRRSSGSSQKSTATESIHSDGQRTRSKISLVSRAKPGSIAEAVPEEITFSHNVNLSSPSIPTSSDLLDRQSGQHPPTPPKSPFPNAKATEPNPRLTVEEPTPDQVNTNATARLAPEALSPPIGEASPRRQSIASGSQQTFLNNLLQSYSGTGAQTGAQDDYFSAAPVLSPSMLHRKIWVRRPGASATLVQLSEDDLVDDARDKILRKYANSLGRTFDSPDVTLRIVPRGSSHGVAERTLGPEESITRALDLYFPEGQSVDEALVIDVPHRRTPRHSPRVYAEYRPPESGTDYFSVMPVPLNHSPHLPSTISVTGSAGSGPQIHAMSVINTGHVPPLPSPGGTRRHASHRPKVGRTTTSSPTILTSNPPHIDSRPVPPGTPSAPPLPTPPLSTVVQPKVATPPARVSSPRPSKVSKPKKAKKSTMTQPPPTSLLEGGVPPINVLIVEDNMINLKLLEAFMKRLKVRWHTAMNGREAVNKWRAGGFHLVLMDIQLPVMNGLDATKEIRRLERENGIGVFAAKIGDTDSVKEDDESQSKPQGADKLDNRDSFKSPVIIVALTASSLQSDRHEALAAGCNDFLTKPVNFVWLERKVMEWGCMQALIDFDGWRKWKEFSTGFPNSKNTKALPKGTSTEADSSPVLGSTTKTKKSTSTSDSAGSSDSASNHNGSISHPNTLTALNAQHSESADTLESVSTTDSIASTETAAPMSSVVTLTPSGSFSRQTSSQATKQVTQPYSATTLRAPSPKLQPNPSKQQFQNKPAMQQQDDRRRKRSSLGRSGLSGVVEEMEDGKGVGVGA